MRDRLTAALTETHEFCRTIGRHRADGAYVVSRRGASSTGHRKVFDSFEQCRRRFEELPTTFTAADVATPGVTGGRRHMLVWHFVERPTFGCDLLSKQPLTARKADLSIETEVGTQDG